MYDLKFAFKGKKLEKDLKLLNILVSVFESILYAVPRAAGVC